MLARHRGLSCLLFLLAASSLRIIAETTPAAALNLAIAKFHERGGGVQEEEDDNNHRRSYFVKLCPTRLETYDKLIERLNGDKVYFFNLSEACPGIVVTDSDGYNYVAVDSRSGVVSFFIPSTLHSITGRTFSEHTPFMFGPKPMRRRLLRQQWISRVNTRKWHFTVTI